MEESAVKTRNHDLIFRGIGPFPDRNPEKPSLRGVPIARQTAIFAWRR